MTKSVFALLILVSLGSIASADDLYQVTVDSHDAAAELKACRIDVVLRTDDGYLVLVNDRGYDRLARSGLSFQRVADDVQREELAIDIRHDRSNRDRFQILFEEGELRLFRVDPIEAASLERTPGLAPVPTEGIPVVFHEGRPLSLARLDQMLDLDSLINLVEQDSLESYSAQLESFMWRVTGTSGNYISRNWIIDKLGEFGYDSILIDSFVTEIYDRPHKVYNVVAVKPGTVYPRHEIIVGAHRDAVPGSPGADDNGSGTVATLEIARILSDIDLEMTFKFILFDGEEQGLHGSYHYAGAAARSGDSIVFMLNMDMIAHFQNDSESKIYRSSSSESYAQLWQTLADSLTGINIAASLRSMSGGSDHYPFYLNGFAAIFVQENIFSSVYHSPRDSTTYMNFDYFTRMTKASLASAYAVNSTYEVAPMLFMNYEFQGPTIFYPGRDTTLAVSIEEYADEQLIPSSGQFHYSVDGAEYVTVALADVGGNNFQATLPGQGCYSAIEFYFSAEGAGSGVVYFPDPSQPLMAVAATAVTTTFADDFETDQMWTVDSGAVRGNWERSQPGSGGYGAPGSDYDNSGRCYLTDPETAADVDDGMSVLYSPVIGSSAGRTVVEYARWYSNSTAGAPYEDIFSVYLSTDGGLSWPIIETVGPVEGADGGWVLSRYWAEEVSESPTALQLRFAVSDNGDDSQVEAAVDAVRIMQYTCYPLVITDQLPDWTEGMAYSQQLTVVGGDGVVSFSDDNSGLAGTGLALSTSGLVSGTPLNMGIISFTAVATDEMSQSDTVQYEFQINGTLTITSTTLGDATAGQVYSQQLAISGGTSPVTWLDLNDDLAGTGLTLASDGLLSGTPSDTGTVTLIARVDDVAGAFDEQSLSLRIRVFFICGDIDHSGADPDIGDLVYLVDFMFNDGPPPPVIVAADVDASGGDLDIADLVYLVDYMFTGGPPPVCP